MKVSANKAVDSFAYVRTKGFGLDCVKRCVFGSVWCSGWMLICKQMQVYEPKGDFCYCMQSLQPFLFNRTKQHTNQSFLDDTVKFCVTMAVLYTTYLMRHYCNFDKATQSFE